jgi:hypothetical protein
MLIGAFLVLSVQEAQAINPQPILKGAGKLLKPLQKHFDDLFTLAPVVVMLFAKAGGIATTLVTAVYARTKRSKKATFLVCLTLGITGGIWTSQVWFGCPFSCDIGLYNILVTTASCVAAILIWVLIAFSTTIESGEEDPEQASGGNG